MTLQPGTQLLNYRLAEKLGEGGMGVVWKAVDTDLGREVAIKVLPDALSDDEGRLARFEREAKLLATLNHTNVAAIYGLHTTQTRPDGPAVRFLAMELVRGETLSQRIAQGPLPLDEALEFGRQIASGLEAAHRSGIVHRDLKPSNVMLTGEGEVKLLDFGLAKAVEDNPIWSRSDPATSPTMTPAAGTTPGLIMGTASYMSPEQARGRPVDRRADVWSFGAVLFEMLAGSRALPGDSTPEVLALLLRGEPDWEALPPTVPPAIRRLLRRCLCKKRDKRLHHIADARIEIEDVLAGTVDEPDAPAPAPPQPRVDHRWTFAALAVALLAVGYAIVVGRSESPQPSADVVRLDVSAEMLDFSAAALPFALSPDGTTLAYIDYDGPATRLFLRHTDSFDVMPLPETEGATAPFFSPGGEWLGFYAAGELRKVAVAGGKPISLCPAPHSPGGATWLTDGTIVFSMAFTPTGLYRVSAEGGEPAELAIPVDAGEGHNFKEPQVLPGERKLIFTIVDDTAQRVGVLSLEDGTYETLNGVRGRARYVSSGHLLAGDGESLLAFPFDIEKAEITGEPFSVLDAVRTFQGGASFAVSDTGTLAYLPAVERGLEHVWVDRDGTLTPLGIEEASDARPALSNDNRRVAMSGGTLYDNQSLHIHDLVRGGRIRVPGAGFVQWSPDDSHIYVMLRPEKTLGIFRLPSDGSGEPELLHVADNNRVPTGISPDGRWLLFYEQNPETSRDVWVLNLEAGDAFPLVASPANERSGVFSPDGRWYAYTSNASGRDEVYVRPFQPNGGKGSEFLLSTNGGREPRWSRDGQELFYRVGRAMMAVPIRLGVDFEADEPRMLFEGNWAMEVGGLNQYYDVTRDGRRFLMVRTSDAANRIRVVVNWLQEAL